VARTDGTGEQQITDDAAKDWSPLWSPDGTRIAFYTNETGDYEIWLAEPDGTDRVRLTDTPGKAPQRPLWSPAGDRLVTYLSGDSLDAFFVEVGEPPRVQSIDEVEHLPPVEAGNGQFQAFDWHPDGSLLVGTVDPGNGGGQTAIWLYDIEGRSYRYLADGLSPVFMADGARVLFASPDRRDLFAIDIAGGERRPVLGVPPNENIALAPDNRRMYLVRVDQESDIWLAELRQQ
jgi:TolB protein